MTRQRSKERSLQGSLQGSLKIVKDLMRNLPESKNKLFSGSCKVLGEWGSWEPCKIIPWVPEGFFPLAPRVAGSLQNP